MTSQLDKLAAVVAGMTPRPWEAELTVSFKDPDQRRETMAIYHRPEEFHIVEVIESPDKLKGECIHHASDHEGIALIRNVVDELIAAAQAAESASEEYKTNYRTIPYSQNMVALTLELSKLKNKLKELIP